MAVIMAAMTTAACRVANYMYLVVVSVGQQAVRVGVLVCTVSFI